MEANLTKPQKTMLNEIRTAGVKVYNGRARRTIEALEAASLVAVDWEWLPQSKGNGMEIVQRITVTALPSWKPSDLIFGLIALWWGCPEWFPLEVPG